MSDEYLYRQLARGNIHPSRLAHMMAVMASPPSINLADTPFNLTDARASWTITNVVDTDIVSKYAAASANTLLVLPAGTLGSAWAGKTLTPSGADNVWIVEHASGSTFTSAPSNTLFTFTGTPGANNGIQFHIDGWQTSSVGNDGVLDFSGLSGSSIIDPFRVSGSFFKNIGDGTGAQAVIEFIDQSKFIHVDHTTFDSGIKKLGIRWFIGATEVPQDLKDYRSNDTFFTREVNASELSYDESVFGSGHDCGVNNVLFQNSTTDSQQALQIHNSNVFAPGSQWMSPRAKIYKCKFDNWRPSTGELITMKSTSNLVEQVEIKDCTAGIYQRNGNTNTYRKMYIHGTNQREAVSMIGGSGNVFEDIVAQSSSATSDGGIFDFRRWGESLSDPENYAHNSKDTTFTRLSLFGDTASPNQVMRLGGLATAHSNADNLDAAKRINEHLDNITFTDLQVITNHIPAITYEPGDYSTFQFKNDNVISASGTKVWTSGTGSVGDMAVLDSGYVLNDGAAPDHTVLGPATIGTYTAGQTLL